MLKGELKAITFEEYKSSHFQAKFASEITNFDCHSDYCVCLYFAVNIGEELLHILGTVILGALQKLQTDSPNLIPLLYPPSIA